MSDPREQEPIESTFGSKSVQEEYLRKDIENYQKDIKFYQTLIEGLEKRISEKDDLIAHLYSEVANLKTELFNLKLRSIGTSDSDRQQVISQALTIEDVRGMIKTKKQAIAFRHMMEIGQCSYTEIAKAATLNEQYVINYLKKSAKLIRKPKRGHYAVIEDPSIRKSIEDVILELGITNSS